MFVIYEIIAKKTKEVWVLCSLNQVYTEKVAKVKLFLEKIKIKVGYKPDKG